MRFKNCKVCALALRLGRVESWGEKIVYMRREYITIRLCFYVRGRRDRSRQGGRLEGRRLDFRGRVQVDSSKILPGR